MNLYGFAGGDPINFSDPFGLCPPGHTACLFLRLPRDLSGRDLARALRRYGYEVTRETGSHMRLTTQQGDAAGRRA